MAINETVRIVQNKHGIWELHYKNPDGRRRRLSAKTSDKSVARHLTVKFTEWLMEGKDPEQELEQARKRNQARSISIKQFFPVFMERHGSKNSLSTQTSYQNSIKNIKRCPDLSECKLNMINKGILLDYMNARIRMDNVTPATVNREVALLKVMMSCAVEWDILEHNPLQRFRLLKEGPKREVTLSVEEAAELLKRLSEPVANIVEFALYSGMRRENILSLKIENLVLNDDWGTANVVLKGDRRDNIVLGQNAVEVLQSVIGRRRNGYVFVNPKTGKRYVTIHKSFNRIVREMGLTVNGTKFRFHDLRHAFAGFLVNHNVGLEAIRSLMKHKDRSTTDRYATIDSEFSKQALAAMPKIPRIRDKKTPKSSKLQLIRSTDWQELAG
ncbi:tyrosine-type recombinase/integrase [candidate division KSB1 bacterium]